LYKSLLLFLKDIEMKKIALIAALGLMGMGSAMAQTAVPADFNVTVTLTSKCRVDTATPYTLQTLNFGTYDAFGGASIAAPSVNVTFECTRGMSAPTVAFDTGTDKTSTATAATASGEGVVSGLRYTLSAAAGARSAGNAATAGAPGSNGSADIWTYAVTGAMPAGQAGTTSTGVQTQARQLIITY
jgi:hypothetical protein